MIKKLAALLLCGWAFSCGPTTANAQDFDLMRNQTVRIETPTGVGSGVVVGPNTILTASHVIEGDTEIMVSFNGVDEAFKAQSNVQTFGEVDAALIHLPIKGTAKVAPITCDQQKQGDRIVMVGFPLDLMYMYSEGYVSGIDLWKLHYYLAFIPINHGNSGGPVFDDKGNVVALAQGGISSDKGQGEDISVLTALSTICNELKKGIY